MRPAGSAAARVSSFGCSLAVGSRTESENAVTKTKGKHWFSFAASGTDWDVRIATEKDAPELAGSEGITDPSASTIYLDSGLVPSRRTVVLVHELLHALLSTPGEFKLMARILGCSPDEASAREEELVTHLAPKLCDALCRSGILKLPKAPK